MNLLARLIIHEICLSGLHSRLLLQEAFEDYI